MWNRASKKCGTDVEQRARCLHCSTVTTFFSYVVFDRMEGVHREKKWQHWHIPPSQSMFQIVPNMFSKSGTELEAS